MNLKYGLQYNNRLRYNSCSTSRSDFFLRSGHNRINRLSYDNKTTDKREHYNWKTEKNWTARA